MRELTLPVAPYEEGTRTRQAIMMAKQPEFADLVRAILSLRSWAAEQGRSIYDCDVTLMYSDDQGGGRFIIQAQEREGVEQHA